MTGSDGMTLLYVPAGEFIMGSDSGTFSPAERPAHTISLDAYWIDQTEITNAMYTLCVQNGQCKHTDTADYSNQSYANHPVVYVSWNDANNYCSWVGRRLPSEAEWEKAARGTDGRNYPWGNNEPDANLLNFKMNIADTTTVGNYPDGASPYGVYDMAGNVFEWVNDWLGETYYQSSPYSNPLGPTSGKDHVMRGGAWNSNKVFIRSTVRLAGLPSYMGVNIGFRCARSAE